MITYVSLCAFIECQGCGYSGSPPRRDAIRAAGAAGRGSVDPSPAETSVPGWEDEQSWGHPAVGGSALGGPSWAGRWEPHCHGERERAGHGCCRDPFPKMMLWGGPGWVLGWVRRMWGYFAVHWRESWCVCAGQEATKGCQEVFLGKCFFFFLNCDSALVSAPVQSRFSSPQTRAETRQ